MIDRNVQEMMPRMENIILKKITFICTNDGRNWEVQKDVIEDYELVVQAFYDTLFPFPSQFEKNQQRPALTFYEEKF